MHAVSFKYICIFLFIRSIGETLERKEKIRIRHSKYITWRHPRAREREGEKMRNRSTYIRRIYFGLNFKDRFCPVYVWSRDGRSGKYCPWKIYSALSGPAHNLFPFHLYSRLKLFARFPAQRIIIILLRLSPSLSLAKGLFSNFATRAEFWLCDIFDRSAG